MTEQNLSSVCRLMPMEAIEAEFGILVEIPPLPSGALDMEAINFHLATDSLWTLVDGGPVPTFTSGYHIVNRMGYYCSARSVPIGMIIDEQCDESIGNCSDCDALWDTDFDSTCPNCGGGSFVGPNY